MQFTCFAFVFWCCYHLSSYSPLSCCCIAMLNASLLYSKLIQFK